MLCEYPGYSERRCRERDDGWGINYEDVVTQGLSGLGWFEALNTCFDYMARRTLQVNSVG